MSARILAERHGAIARLDGERLVELVLGEEAKLDQCFAQFPARAALAAP